MPTTTPNFGWSVPVSTDLVKDGATAIELLGDSIDTSFVDLLGGTTGQVLTKASGTDLDFSFTTPAAASAGLTLIASESFSAVTSKSINSCFSATFDNYMIYVNINSVTGGNFNFLKLRVGSTDNSVSYNFVRVAAFDSTIFAASSDNQTTGYQIGTSSADSGGATRIDVYNPALAQDTYFYSAGNRKNGGNLEFESSVGNHNVATAFDGLTLITTGSAFAGNIRVYGVQNA